MAIQLKINCSSVSMPGIRALAMASGFTSVSDKALILSTEDFANAVWLCSRLKKEGIKFTTSVRPSGHYSWGGWLVIGMGRLMAVMSLLVMARLFVEIPVEVFQVTGLLLIVTFAHIAASPMARLYSFLVLCFTPVSNRTFTYRVSPHRVEVSIYRKDRKLLEVKNLPRLGGLAFESDHLNTRGSLAVMPMVISDIKDRWDQTKI